MLNTNLNIRIEKDLKEQAKKMFAELGLDMSTAVTLFLKQSVRENGLPFELTLNSLNEQTIQAIKEGKQIAHDKNIKGCTSIDELRKSLEI